MTLEEAEKYWNKTSAALIENEDDFLKRLGYSTLEELRKDNERRNLVETPAS